MKTSLKTKLLSFLTNRLPWNANLSYSQFGEDVQLWATLRFCGFERGTYLDVGAHHPVWLSNTYALYQRGWRGVTVEPNPQHAELFRAVRPKDTHYVRGVAPDPGELTFYSFGPNSLQNSFSREYAEKVGQSFTEQKIECVTLNQILDEHGPVDLLSVDCEGIDYPILKSLDWSKYRPFVVVYEDDGVVFEDAVSSPIYQLLKSHGYQLLAKMGPSFIARQPKTVR